MSMYNDPTRSPRICFNFWPWHLCGQTCLEQKTPKTTIASHHLSSTSPATNISYNCQWDALILWSIAKGLEGGPERKSRPRQSTAKSGPVSTNRPGSKATWPRTQINLLCWFYVVVPTSAQHFARMDDGVLWASGLRQPIPTTIYPKRLQARARARGWQGEESGLLHRFTQGRKRTQTKPYDPYVHICNIYIYIICFWGPGFLG